MNKSFLNVKDNLPRGIRNNNPGNLVQSDNKWKGKIVPSADSRFEQFSDIHQGIRAFFVLIHTYFKKYGLNTVSKIINRYAPSSENNTASYIKFVCQQTGFTPNEVLTFEKFKMLKLAKAVFIKENGNIDRYITDSDIEYGWNLAFGYNQHLSNDELPFNPDYNDWTKEDTLANQEFMKNIKIPMIIFGLVSLVAVFFIFKRK